MIRFLYNWNFKCLSARNKIGLLKEKGIFLGSRFKRDRKVYLYMIHDFFVEVIYHLDNIDLAPERLETFSNLENLNRYLENDLHDALEGHS